MANSRYEYVKSFEQNDTILPNTWVVVRIDGRGFHKFAAKHGFVKPNDDRALNLMNAAAKAILNEIWDVIIAYGVSDEYSFVLHRSCSLFERRASKLMSTIVSTFTAYYVHLWSTYFPDSPLSSPLPSFDGRVVQYPTWQNLRDYMSWRQVDCHINNLYNTTFWALVQLGGMDAKSAEHELAVSGVPECRCLFKINYNNESEMHKKGSIVLREYALEHHPASSITEDQYDGDAPQSPPSRAQADRDKKRRGKAVISILHVDIIKDDFWNCRPWLQTNKPGRLLDGE